MDTVITWLSSFVLFPLCLLMLALITVSVVLDGRTTAIPDAVFRGAAALCLVLGAGLIQAKLYGVIAWSWWLVLLPLYPVLAVLGLCVAVLAASVMLPDPDRGWH